MDTCGSAVTPSLKSNSRMADLARPLFLHCWNGPLLPRELATQQASSAATLSNNRCKVTKKLMFKAFQSQALEWDPAAWQIDTDCTCRSAVTPSLKSNSRTADLARPLFLHCWNGPLLPRELATQQASSAATLSNNRCKVTKKHMFKAFQSQALEWDPAAWQIDTDCTCGSAVTPSLKSNSRTADLARPLFLHCWNGPLLPRELATQQASSAATLSNNRCKVTKKHMFKAFQSQALEWEPCRMTNWYRLHVWERRNTKSQIQLENGWLGPPAFLALLKWTASTKRTSDPTSVQRSNSQQQPLQSHKKTHVQSISKPSFGMGPCRMTNWYRLHVWERRNTKSQIQLENGWLGPPAFLALLKWTASTKRTNDPTSVQRSNSQQQPLQSHKKNSCSKHFKAKLWNGTLPHDKLIQVARVGAP